MMDRILWPHNPSPMCTGAKDFFSVSKYTKDGDGYFASFKPKKETPPTEEEKAKHPFLSDRRYIPARVHIKSEKLKEELSRGYFPGGIFLEFTELDSGLWLVRFAANSILAARYMTLSSEDGRALLALAEPC